jgi:two-component system sensor histidine kinase KdpD
VRMALECAAALAAVCLTAGLAHWLAWFATLAPLVCGTIVIATAMRCGFPQAALVACAAVAAPVVLAARQPAAQPVDILVTVIELTAFLLAALAAAMLSARAQAQAREAKAWEGQMRDLYEFTRRTLEMNLHVEPGPQLAELAQEIFALEAVVLFDADLHETYEAGYWALDPRELARNVYYFETCDDDAATGVSRRVLRLGSVPIGSMVLRGATSPLTNDAIASLVATTFDRYRAFANEGQIDSERRTEQLRSTVLDSLAHAYKTPLTAIRAASSGLTQMGRLSPSQSELVSLIDEQAGVLNELTTELLTTATLDAEKVALETTPITVKELIDEVVGGLKERLASMKAAIHLEDDNLAVCCDRKLMVMLLTQYVDNACKYSHYGSTVTIGAERGRAETVFSVHSFGPEIPPADRERIFDRYYRSSHSSHSASGTGIGLAVARRAAQLHGGHVWATSDEVKGTTFFAAIPTAPVQRSSK